MQFRKHKITRNCKKQYANYQDYKPYLAEDFHHRCAYCNLFDDNVDSFFEVDHFVPQAEIKKNPRFSYLTTDYDILFILVETVMEKKAIFMKATFLKALMKIRDFMIL